MQSQNDTLLFSRLNTALKYYSTGSEAKRGRADPFVGYRAGGLRALVCGEEAATGCYPILRSYTSLLTAAVKVKRCWRCDCVMERVELWYDVI